MIQACGEVGLAFEAAPEFVIGRQFATEHLDGIHARQTGMFGQVDRSHTTGTQLANDPIPTDDGAGTHHHQ